MTFFYDCKVTHSNRQECFLKLEIFLSPFLERKNGNFYKTFFARKTKTSLTFVSLPIEWGTVR
jgi:hypothetical protein